jgi:hypothetical protein
MRESSVCKERRQELGVQRIACEKRCPRLVRVPVRLSVKTEM